MRIFYLSVLTFLFISCGTNRAIYQSPDFEQQTSRHKTVAILPVYMVQTGHIPKEVSEADVKAANEKWGYIFQETLQSFILKQTQKNKKGQMVSFQSTQKTNAIVKEQKLSVEALYSRQPEEIARLLGVDAVIMTNMNHNKNFSDGVAYGLAAARTVVNVFSRSATLGAGVNASDVNINCSLFDAKDSKLLWKTYRDGGTDLPANVNELIEHYSNWIAKKLPYKS
ncbi:MAG TPA: hypothetical protein VGN63_19945 [Flavisolibacter sp.]|jgi:hypothetical protein|nr:hypothetical protein [Flavisolibacter sp.]